MRTRTTITNWVVALVAVALGFVAQGYFLRGEVTDALIVYAVAAALFLWAVRGYGALFTPPPEPTHPDDDRAADPANESYRWAGAALFVAAVLATFFALRAFQQDALQGRGWVLYLVAMGLLLASAYFADRAEGRRFQITAHTPFLTWREGIVLLLILGVGAFMRFYRFGDWPYGTWYDEADNALHVIAMMQDPSYRPVFVPSTNLPAHFLYLIFISFKVFGPTTQAIRVVTAIMGLGTVVGAYLFGRELLGRQMALVLAFFLAVSRWDVNFSRIGLHGVSTPLFELLVLYFLLRGLRTARRSDFAWAGVLAGLGLCFYAPFRLFPFVVVLFLLHVMVVEGKGFWQKHAMNLIVLGAAGLIAFAPVIQYAREHTESFWGRTEKVSIFKSVPAEEVWPAVAGNVQKHLLMFNYRGDPNGRHNLPGEPMLDYITGALAVIGLIYALSRARHPRYLLLVLWLAIMLCGGIFSLPFEAPQSLRAIGALPAAYVLACLPLGLIRLETWRVFPRAGGKCFRMAAALLLAAVGWSNYHTYFDVQAQTYASWIAYSTVETVMAQQINGLDPGYDRYYSEVLTNHLTTQYLAPGAGEQTPFEPARHLPFRESGDKGVAVFFDRDSLDTIDLIQFYYPQAVVQRFKPPFRDFEFLALVLIDREQIEAIQGLAARYFHEGAESMSNIYRQDRVMRFDWREDAPLEPPFDVEWRGVLTVPEYGCYGLRVVGPPEGVVVLLDGARLLGGTEPLTRDVLLASGRHALRIRIHVDGNGSFDLQWRPPEEVAGAGQWATIPQNTLFGSPVNANGLIGTYYPNDNWEGPPALVRVDPEIDFYFHLIPLSRPYSVEWSGRLEIPAAGDYIFGVEVRDAAYLYIDDTLFLANERPDGYYEQTVHLDAGQHDLRLRYLDRTDHSHVYLYWITPGVGRTIVPYQRLTPPVGGGWEPGNCALWSTD